MPLDPSIPLQTTVPNAMSNLGNVFNVANSIQQYKSGNIELQKQQQVNQERMATQQFMSNPDNWQTDGRIDMDKLNAAIPKIAPMTGADQLQKMSTLSSAQTAADQAKTNMTTGQRSIVAGMLSAYGYAGVKDPKIIADGMDKLISTYGADSPMGKFAASQKTLLGMVPPGDHVPEAALKGAANIAGSDMPQNSPQGLDLSKLSPAQQKFLMRKDPAAFARGAQDFQQTSNSPQQGQAPQGMSLPQQGILAGQALMSPGEQQAANTPSTIGFDTGRSAGAINIKPGIIGAPQGSVVASYGKETPVGSQQSLEKDALGNTVIVNRDNHGNIISTSPVPGGNGGGGFQSLPPGETPQTLAAASTIRQGANAAAASAPDQQFNANQIIKYAHEGITGKGAQWMANLRGGMTGLQSTGDGATDTQLLGHAIAQQTATLANAAGLSGSNAKIDLSAEMTAKGDWTEKAIQSSARVMRALGSTGATLYNQGINNAADSGGPFAARKFQNDWAKTANVDSIRLYDAMKNRDSDPDGLKQVVESIGGADSSRYKSALSKIAPMKALINGGQ